MAYAGLARKRRIDFGAESESRNRVIVFAHKDDLAGYQVTAHWTTFILLSSMGVLRVFVSEFDPRRRYLRRTHHSIGQLASTCRTLFESNFRTAALPTKSMLDPDLCKLLRYAGFNNGKVCILLQDWGRPVLHKLIGDKAFLVADSA